MPDRSLRVIPGTGRWNIVRQEDWVRVHRRELCSEPAGQILAPGSVRGTGKYDDDELDFAAGDSGAGDAVVDDGVVVEGEADGCYVWAESVAEAEEEYGAAVDEVGDADVEDVVRDDTVFPVLTDLDHFLSLVGCAPGPVGSDHWGPSL